MTRQDGPLGHRFAQRVDVREVGVVPQEEIQGEEDEGAAELQGNRPRGVSA